MITVDITNVVLETQHLILRYWNEDDVYDFFEYASVEGVGEMAGWMHHDSIETTKRILGVFIEGKNVFAITLKSNHKVIGSLGLHKRDSVDKCFEGLSSLEIGYVLSKEYWGRGIMVEAVNAAIKFCFDVLNLDVLTVGHFVTNHQSKRVIEKAGFTYYKDGVFESKQLKKSFEDVCYYLYNPHRVG